MARKGVMGSNLVHSFSDHLRRILVGRDAQSGDYVHREAAALERRWGVATCARCGRAIMMGEPVARVRGRDVTPTLCVECLAPAPAAPLWVAAPERHDREPVRLVKPQSDLERAA
jgi:hypothetical protein